MPYFFDTNIIIGYVFIYVDRLGIRAMNRVNDIELNHTGYNTQIECFGGRYDAIQNEVSKEFVNIKAQILRHEPINYQQYPRIENIAKKVLCHEGTNEQIDVQLLHALSRFLDSTFEKRKKNILDPKICEWHSKRDKDYTEVRSKLVALKGIHRQDAEVLLDAYEVGKSVPNLVFITDDKDIIRNKEAICEYLGSISDIIPP